MGKVFSRIPAFRLDLAFRRIPLTAHLIDPAPGPDLLNRHLVPGDGPCLIRADHGGRAQGLHGRHAPDDGVAARHAPHTQGQGYADHGRQPFRNRGDGNGHRKHQHLHHLVAAEHAEPEDACSKGDAANPEDHSQLVHSLLQRGIFPAGGADLRRDTTDLGLHACCDHHGPAPAAGHAG